LPSKHKSTQKGPLAENINRRQFALNSKAEAAAAVFAVRACESVIFAREVGVEETHRN